MRAPPFPVATPARPHPPANFDRVARAYRWLEYIVFGPALQRCRVAFLPEVLGCRRALVLGDGDGRFLAQLLAHNREIQAVAVDLSPAMLALLRRRCEQTSPTAVSRLDIVPGDALSAAISGSFDLVVTHFFLDCLSEEELDRLLDRLAPSLTPDALWLLSDFRVPGGLLRLPALALVRALYLAFRVLTGLHANHLPDHEAALRRAGLSPLCQRRSLSGILTAELWQRHPSLPSAHPKLVATLKETS